MDIKRLVPDGVRFGQYANMAAVSHNGPGEIDVEFLKMQQTGPDSGEALVVAKLTLSPTVVKQLIEALEQNLERYEQKYGPAPMPARVQ